MDEITNKFYKALKSGNVESVNRVFKLSVNKTIYDNKEQTRRHIKRKILTQGY